MFQPCAIDSSRNSLAQGGGATGRQLCPAERASSITRPHAVSGQAGGTSVRCRVPIQKLLERCNIKLASVASNVLGVSGTGYAAWPVQTDGVQKAERRLHQPTSVEAPSRTCHKALLATIKKVGPSHIPVFYSMTRQSRVPARRASAAAHDTVWSLRLLRRGRGPLQFR